MSVGAISPHSSYISGRLTITLVDGEGNIKTIRHQNIVNTMAKKAIASCMFNGQAGFTAIYAVIFSGVTATPSLSQLVPFSAVGNPSINLTNNPATLTWSFHNDTQWSMNGTMTFVGYGGYSSVDGAALCWQPTNSLSWADRSWSQWFAAACFTDLAINSVDKLSFNWAFSLSTTTSTAV
jgi:hypothetical protein